MNFTELPENIKEKIHVLGNHWIWTGAVSNENRSHKQGVVRFEGKTRKINRVVFHLATGFDLDSKLQINHKTDCNMELCCNPDCLYTGTQQENVIDREESFRGRYASKSTCNFGHDLKISPTTGHRYCPTCENKRRDEWRKRKSEL